MKKTFNDALTRKIEPEFKRFMEKAETVRWSIASIDFKKIETEKLTLSDLFAVFVTLHIENYSDVYTRLLLKHHEDLPLVQSFIKNWEREEENHARVLEHYLVTLGMSLEELEANYAKVDKNDFPFPSENQTGLNAFVFIQELLTREMYSKILKTAKEPVLVDILKRIVRDEERHFRFYRMTLNIRKELDEKDTMAQFLEILKTFGMPKTMFQQLAMTDQLMTYYRYSAGDIVNIADPVIKFLEATPHRKLENFPKLQRAWVLRRAVFYLAQSPYIWRHAAVSLKNKFHQTKLNTEEKEHVQSVLDRLQQLL